MSKICKKSFIFLMVMLILLPTVAVKAATSYMAGGSFEVVYDRNQYWYTSANANKDAVGSITNREENAFVEDPEDSSNTVLKIGAYSLAYYITLDKIPAGKYKLTLRYYGTEDTSVPMLWLAAGNKKLLDSTTLFLGRQMGAPVTQKGKWQEYTLYFNNALERYITVYLGSHQISANGYYDDITLKADDSSTIQYVDAATFSDDKGVSTYQDNRKFVYRGNSVEKISEATNGENGYGLTAVGHYIPETEGDESFNLISAVYRINKETNSVMLWNTVIKPGTTTGGVDKTLSTSVSVPSEDDTYTYKVRSFLISELSSLKALQEAVEITY